MFVEAACRDMLHIASRAEKAAARAHMPRPTRAHSSIALLEPMALPCSLRRLSSRVNGPIWCRRSHAPLSHCMSRVREPMRARWRATDGTRTRPPTSPPAGSGPSPSASRSRAMPRAGVRARCLRPCAKLWASWLRHTRRDPPLGRHCSLSPARSVHPPSRGEVSHGRCHGCRSPPHRRPRASPAQRQLYVARSRHLVPSRHLLSGVWAATCLEVTFGSWLRPNAAPRYQAVAVLCRVAMPR
jgi:hypothetical protein